jgi:thiol-disulfide isomerase/thioredoxin
MMRLLPLFVSMATGAVCAALVTRIIPAFRTRGKELFFAAGSIFLDALLAGLVVWKLSPLFLHARYFALHPGALLFAPGGGIGIVAGSGAALLVSLFRLVYRGKHAIAFEMRKKVAFLLLVWYLAAALTALAYQAAAHHGFLPAETDVGSSVISASEYQAFDGNRYPLFEENSVTVVNFWASWCGPCKGELPEMISFYEKTLSAESGGRIRFLTVNLTATEKSHSQVASFIVKEQLPFPVIEDIDGRLSTAFAVSSIPSTIIMAPDGRIITELKGVQSAASLEREARSALNKLEE